MKNKKGLLFTIDAIIGLIIAITIIIAAENYVSTSGETGWGDKNLQQLEIDSIQVMEYTNSIHEAMNENTTKIKDFLTTRLPDNTCGKITIYNSAETNIIYTFTKPGCNETERRSSIIRRGVVEQNQMYTVKMEGWSKKQ